MDTLEQKILQRTAKIAILGGGYVGLPLAVEFAKSGFPVVVFDTDQSKIAKIKSGVSYIPDVSTQDVQEMVAAGRLSAASSFETLDDMDAAIICVPTPLKKTKEPDVQYIVAACESITEHLHAPMLISLESSTFPGTTDELMLPMFTQEGLEVGRDFFLCYSPERVDPGNGKWQTKNIPKVVGGITPACTAMGAALYGAVIDQVVPVNGTRVAEMVKLLENTFRLINIGLVNEMAVMCDRMNVDIWEVINAAATKPFGFMPFRPGPGVGGHCIAVDPFYLAWKVKQVGVEPRFIDLAGQINGQMPHYVAQKIATALNSDHKPVNGSYIHLVGMAYKRDIDDVRESPALDVAHLLLEAGAEITFYDPYVESIRLDGGVRLGETLEGHRQAVADADCVVILTDHTSISYQEIADQARLIVDTRNAMAGFVCHHLVKL